MKRAIKVHAKWALFFMLISLAGCMSPSHPVLRSDYVEYARNYADASNQQLLLNLARLANDDPVNFLQLASLSSQYQFTAGIGANSGAGYNYPGFYNSGSTITTGGTPPTGMDTITRSIGNYVKNTLTFGGSANAAVTATPVFQFVPLTGSNLVSAIMTPINDKVFYTFYDQGYPADLLARTMVASVKYQSGITKNSVTNCINTVVSNDTVIFIQTNQANADYIISNTLYATSVTKSNATNFDFSDKSWTNITKRITTTANGSQIVSSNCIVTHHAMQISTTFITNYVYYVNSPRSPSYSKFLEFCNKLRRAQTDNFLTVGPKPGGDTVIYDSTNTRLTDVVAAVQANLTAKYDTNTGQIKITQSQKDDSFIKNIPVQITNNEDAETGNSDLDADYESTSKAFTEADIFSESQNLPIKNQALRSANFLEKYTRRQYDYEPQNAEFQDVTNFADEYQDKYFLKMRTVEAAMYTAAQEEPRFRNLVEVTNSEVVKGLLNFSNYPAFRELLKTDNRRIFFKLLNTNCCAFSQLSNLTAKAHFHGALQFQVSSDFKTILTCSNYSSFRQLLRSTDRNTFYQLAQQITNDIVYCSSPNGPFAIVIRTNFTPFTVKPLMMLTYPDGEVKPTHVLVHIDYGDGPQPPTPYCVGDNDHDGNQNRFIFTLLSYLFDQATISTQNLPVQQLIQVQ